jgi:hypothetical protein
MAAPASDLLKNRLPGFEGDSDSPFELVYFDARSTRRFRKLGEVKPLFGGHEAEYFESLVAESEPGASVDMWDWHSRLFSFYDSSQVQGRAAVELFSAPRFVRAQGWPVLELLTNHGKLSGVSLAGFSPGESIVIHASKFFLGDYGESLSTLIKDQEDAQVLATALKGRAYRAGFGLRLFHKELASALSQTMVVPLLVNPTEKEASSHLAGRFIRKPSGLESLWVGLLTDEELEDNNEILKKIKQAKRAVERAVPGFSESIQREAVTFEPRMRAVNIAKAPKTEALGAGLVSDHFGSRLAVEGVNRIMSERERM